MMMSISFLLLFSLYQESFGQIQDDLNVGNDTISNTTLSKPTNPNITNFSIYEDKDIGFQIQYPSDWEFDTSSTAEYTVASFKPKGVAIAIDVRIIPQGEYKSLKDYGDKAFKETNQTDSTLLSYYRNSTTTLGGQPAFKTIYLSTYTPSLYESFKGYTSYTSKALFTASFVEPKKSFFAIAYFAPPIIFSNYLPTIEHMIKSFQIDQLVPIIQEED
jgi:hypothetical protein